MATPPLGFITEAQRTKKQHASHARAIAGVQLHHGLLIPTLVKGQKVILTDAWKRSQITADTGRSKFPRIRQITGSCVWAGGTNGLMVTIGTQRLLSENPTKAFVPFTLHNYARSRHAFGDDSEGDGSLGSTFQASLKDDGVDEWVKDPNDKLPDFKEGADLAITREEEYKWSSVRNPVVNEVMERSKKHPLGSATQCKSAQDIKALVLNGYGGSFACNNFIGKASIEGSGADAACIGYWEGRGGHQQWFFGYWEHPNLGPLYGVGNNWDENTYPADPGGLPMCCCWVKEAKVDAAFRLSAEVYGFSNLAWFPAQPDVPQVFDWYA